tara:strand:+ start:497 stop:1006 length:510 start_codon:yes stop_codon:yes gene_type:complete
LSRKIFFVPLGKLGKPHRFNGDIQFLPYNIESKISLQNKNIYLGDDLRNIKKYFVVGYNKNRKILKIKGVNSRELAIAFSKKKLFIDRDYLPKISEHSYYLFDLIGCAVFEKKDKKVGIVQDVLNLPANDVLVVKTENKELLIPLIDDVVKFIDINKKIINIIILPGLI